MSKEFDIIVYHQNCPDGIGGLWCANHYRKIPIHYPCAAGENPILDDIEGKSILFVDVCPQPNYVLKNIKQFSNMTILDHHKSSKEKMTDILKHEFAKLEIIFDMKRSGAQICWDYFFPNCPRPFFIDYIGDQDLWNWNLLFSKEINLALYDFLELEKLDTLYQNENTSLENLKEIGTILRQKNDREVCEVVKNAVPGTFLFNEKKYSIFIVENTNRNMVSDVGNLLCEMYPTIDFSVICFFNMKEKYWNLSLRGIKGKCPDLSFIAKSFGGGGHSSASGLRVPNLLEFENIWF